MAKHKNRRRTGNDPQPNEVRIPLGTFPMGALPSFLSALGGQPAQMGRIEQIERAINPGVWTRTVRRQSPCCEQNADARDGIILTVSATDAFRRVPAMRDYILLTCCDDHGGDFVDVSLDREAARELANALADAVAVSERRANEAAVS